ncbi:Firmicu-CTERM sorting domain-containing protein [Loigolactobacillus jiayinensis]|uniref:Firmicu-CTERM sorting domain-containing protein n=1 Tax=Loigolactobacillus jiayinensis TaxID=2486016 RepID=A0ABW1RCP8_9LACO|nr:Firmicu-CTERM sorting domain-containing protein [Loigolactobacillus jiayinensis]
MTSAGTNVSAATTSTTNWSGISGTKFGWDSTGTIAATNDGTTLYFKVETGTTNWGAVSQYYVKIGSKTYCINVSGNSLTAQDTTDNWKSLGVVGSATTDSKHNVTGSITLAKLNIKPTTAAQTITFSGDGIGSTTTQIAASTTDTNAATTDSSTTDAASSSSANSTSSSAVSNSSSSVTSSSSSSENAASQALAGSSSDQATVSTSQANNNNTSGDLGITINGNFSDWADKTKSAMTESGDSDNVKQVALLADDNNVYFYVSMEPKLQGGYTNFQPSGYVLNVGGKEYSITLNGGQTVNLATGAHQAVKVNIYSGANGVDNNTSGQADVMKHQITQAEYVNGVKKDVTSDAYMVECSIPLSALKGISNTTDQTITLANPNLYTGTVETTGGSTGPVVLAGTGFAIALLSVVKLSGKKRKKLQLNQATRGTK